MDPSNPPATATETLIDKAIDKLFPTPPATPNDKYQVFDEYGGSVSEVGDTPEEVMAAACLRVGAADWQACEKLGLCLGQFEVKWINGWKAKPPVSKE